MGSLVFSFSAPSLRELPSFSYSSSSFHHHTKSIPPLHQHCWGSGNDVCSYASFCVSCRRLPADPSLMPSTIICLSSNDDESPTFLWSTQLVQQEYAHLRLSPTPADIGHVRLRQHVNPFSISLSVPAQVPHWEEVFHDPTLPLMVDVGSGSGRFLIWLANKSPDSNNYLGLEIRQKLVKRANFWAKELSLRNIYFMFANAIMSFEHLVATYPGPVMLVSVLCPDPYFKQRHRKRRVLQKPLVDSISKHLSPGGKVFVQSDIREVAIEMRTQFDALSDMFEHADVVDPNILCDSEGWLLCNPMGIRTEREIHAESGGGKIYRRLYIKRAHMLS